MRIACYLARGVLVKSFVAGLLLFVVYISIDFIEAASALKQPLSDLIGFYPSRLPLMFSHTIPIALAIGVQLTVSSARRTGEWEALESAGIAKWKISTWLLIVPFFAVFLSLLNLMHLSPMALKTWLKDAKTETLTSSKTPKWCKGEENLIGGQSSSGKFIEIEREDDGVAKMFLFTDDSKNTRVWQKDRGWIEMAVHEKMKISCSNSTEIFGTQPMVLQGASRTAPELTEAIDQATRSGWQVAPLKAEQSLRVALAAACLIMPLFALSLGLGKREWGASGLVGLAVVATSLFWLCLAAAWNGAALGAWSPLFVSIMVPGVFLATGSVLIWGFEKV